jgi:hypothetical protein
MKAPPDLTFPPKSRYYASIPPAVIQPRVPRPLPNFGFPSFPCLASSSVDASPTAKSSSAAVLVVPDSTASSPAHPGDASAAHAGDPWFLRIPLEIRFQIYSYVLASHRIHHAHLAPLACEQPTDFRGMNTEEFYTTMLQPAGRSLSSSVAGSGSRHGKETRRWLVSYTGSGEVAERAWTATGRGFQIRGKIPTGLLGCCRQVYDEARWLPFTENTFAFVNWFWSGTYTALRFTQGLRRWQSSAMRHVTMEIPGSHLAAVVRGQGVGTVMGKELTEWIRVCEMWGNVWELQLTIKGHVGIEAAPLDAEARDSRDGEENAPSSSAGVLAPAPRTSASASASTNGSGNAGGATITGDQARQGHSSILDTSQKWITAGLSTLASLRTLSLAIPDAEIPRAEKLTFCADVSRVFNSSLERDDEVVGEMPRREVEVIFIEEVQTVPEVLSNKAFTWYGGEPGDESIWGDG